MIGKVLGRERKRWRGSQAEKPWNTAPVLEFHPVRVKADLAVRTIAERRICGVFALAPPQGFFLGHFVSHRLQPGALV